MDSRYKTIRFNEFWRRVRQANSKLRYIPMGGEVWGLFKKEPGNPMSNEQGLLHLFSLPSPRLFGGYLFPVDIQQGDKYYRGYYTVLRMLVDKGICGQSAINKAFGHRWRWD